MDASTRTISYGDSLGWSLPVSYVTAVHCWLNNHGFALLDKAAMACGEQLDSFSCAIVVINTIKHTIFEHPLFTEDSKYCLCMKEFLVLARSHLEVRLHGYFSGLKKPIFVLLQHLSGHSDSESDNSYMDSEFSVECTSPSPENVASAFVTSPAPDPTTPLKTSHGSYLS